MNGRTLVILILLGPLIANICGCKSQKGYVEMSCPPDKALVYLYRPQHIYTPSPHIKMYVNEAPVVALGAKEYSPLLVIPGSVTFSHGIRYGPELVFSRIMDDLQVQLDAGRTYYVAYRFQVNPFEKRRPVMSLVDETTATNQLSHCKMILPLKNKVN